MRPAAPYWPCRGVDLLAPKIDEAILDGRHPEDMAVLMRSFAVAWTEQRQSNFCCTGKRT